MNIRLTSDILIVSKVLKKTRAELFKDLKEGDRIILSIPVKYAGYNRGVHASYIEVENLSTGKTTYKSFNQLPRLLKCFEFNTQVDV